VVSSTRLLEVSVRPSSRARTVRVAMAASWKAFGRPVRPPVS
jgi:hypothetical protein